MPNDSQRDPGPSTVPGQGKGKEKEKAPEDLDPPLNHAMNLLNYWWGVRQWQRNRFGPPVNYRIKTPGDTRLLPLPGDGAGSEDYKGVLDDYKRIFMAHESFAAHLGVEMSEPALSRKIDGFFHGPISIAEDDEARSRAQPPVTWLDISQYLRCHPHGYRLVSDMLGQKFCKFKLKNVVVTITEQDLRTATSDILERNNLSPALPLEDDELREIFALDFVTKLCRMVEDPEMKAQPHAEIVHFALSSRQQAMIVRRAYVRCPPPGTVSREVEAQLKEQQLKLVQDEIEGARGFKEMVYLQAIENTAKKPRLGHAPFGSGLMAPPPRPAVPQAPPSPRQPPPGKLPISFLVDGDGERQQDQCQPAPGQQQNRLTQQFIRPFQQHQYLSPLQIPASLHIDYEHAQPFQLQYLQPRPQEHLFPPSLQEQLLTDSRQQHLSEPARNQVSLPTLEQQHFEPAFQQQQQLLLHPCQPPAPQQPVLPSLQDQHSLPFPQQQYPFQPAYRQQQASPTLHQQVSQTLPALRQMHPSQQAQQPQILPSLQQQNLLPASQLHNAIQPVQQQEPPPLPQHYQQQQKKKKKKKKVRLLTPMEQEQEQQQQQQQQQEQQNPVLPPQQQQQQQQEEEQRLLTPAPQLEQLVERLERQEQEERQEQQQQQQPPPPYLSPSQRLLHPVPVPVSPWPQQQQQSSMQQPQMAQKLPSAARGRRPATPSRTSRAFGLYSSLTTLTAGRTRKGRARQETLSACETCHLIGARCSQHRASAEDYGGSGAVPQEATYRPHLAEPSPSAHAGMEDDNEYRYDDQYGHVGPATYRHDGPMPMQPPVQALGSPFTPRISPHFASYDPRTPSPETSANLSRLALAGLSQGMTSLTMAPPSYR